MSQLTWSCTLTEDKHCLEETSSFFVLQCSRNANRHSYIQNAPLLSLWWLRRENLESRRMSKTKGSLTSGIFGHNQQTCCAEDCSLPSRSNPSGASWSLHQWHLKICLACDHRWPNREVTIHNALKNRDRMRAESSIHLLMSTSSWGFRLYGGFLH